MLDNKLIIEGVEYELDKGALYSNFGNTPVVVFNGNNYYGKAVHNKPCKDLDYEVLSFLHNGKLYQHTGWGAAKYVNEYGSYLNTPPSNCIIKMVKRLSDGQVFGIGEVVCCGLFRPTEIEKFLPVNDDIEVWGEWVSGINGMVLLSQIEKRKERKYLFTTTDGIYIHEGQEYWFVFPQYTLGNVKSATSKMTGSLSTFSTQEAAKEWLLFNKPVLSLNDLISVWSNGFPLEVAKTAPLFNSFKKLAQEKLK